MITWELEAKIQKYMIDLSQLYFIEPKSRLLMISLMYFQSKGRQSNNA